MLFSVFGCSAPAEKESGAEDSTKTEEAAKTEEEDAKVEEDAAVEEESSEEPQALNEYGITDKQLEAFVNTMKERVQKEYLEVHGINPAEFTWSEDDDFWGGSSITMFEGIRQSYYDGEFITSPVKVVESMIETVPPKSFEEDSNEVNKKDELNILVADICANWLVDEEIDYGKFMSALEELYPVSESRRWYPFIRENVTFE